MKAQKTKTETFEISPIGYIRRDAGKTYVEILPPYVPALKELERFSHTQVLWWFSEFDDDGYRQITQSDRSPYDAPTLGVFACRSPVRPNPIALTVAQIVAVDHEKGRLEITNIDAFDDTPVIDLKAYFPVCDRVKDVRVPPWAADWPEWWQEEKLEEGE